MTLRARPLTERRDEARRLLEDGIDPRAKRQAEHAAQADAFKAIALEWLAKPLA